MMQHKRSILACIVFICAIAVSSCEKHAPTPLYRITIKNNSQQTVCPMLQDWNLMLNADTSLPDVKPNLQIVATGEEARFDNYQDWSKEFSALGLDSATFFFIDAGVYQNNNWVEIRDNYMIIKRVTYSVAELEAANWVIQYP